MPYLELLDDSAWPIVYARFRGLATVEDFDTFANWHDGQIARAITEKTKIVTINDTTGGVSTPPDVRRHIADWMAKSTTPETMAATAGNFVVIDSAITRGVITAIGWAAGDRMGNVVTHPTLDAAYAAAEKAIRAAGLQVPARPPWLSSKAS